MNVFTGNVTQSDTTIEVSINNIRKVNVALIERKYYINIVFEQDSIISLKEDYILEQDKIIKDMQQRIIKETDINNKLKEDYKKQRNKTLIAGGIAGGLGACLIGTVIAIVLVK